MGMSNGVEMGRVCEAGAEMGSGCENLNKVVGQLLFQSFSYDFL